MAAIRIAPGKDPRRNWSHQFALTEEGKGRVGIIVDNKILTVVEPEEVELSVSLPTQSGTEKRFEPPNTRREDTAYTTM